MALTFDEPLKAILANILDEASYDGPASRALDLASAYDLSSFCIMDEDDIKLLTYVDKDNKPIIYHWQRRNI